MNEEGMLGILNNKESIALYETDFGFARSCWPLARRCRSNHFIASCETCSRVPGSSNRWVAPGTISSFF